MTRSVGIRRPVSELAPVLVEERASPSASSDLVGGLVEPDHDLEPLRPFWTACIVRSSTTSKRASFWSM